MIGHKKMSTRNSYCHLIPMCMLEGQMHYSRHVRFIFEGEMNHIERHKLPFETDNSEIHPLVLIKFTLDIIPLR